MNPYDTDIPPDYGDMLDTTIHNHQEFQDFLGMQRAYPEELDETIRRLSGVNDLGVRLEDSVPYSEIESNDWMVKVRPSLYGLMIIAAKQVRDMVWHDPRTANLHIYSMIRRTARGHLIIVDDEVAKYIHNHPRNSHLLKEFIEQEQLLVSWLTFTRESGGSYVLQYPFTGNDLAHAISILCEDQSGWLDGYLAAEGGEPASANPHEVLFKALRWYSGYRTYQYMHE